MSVFFGLVGSVGDHGAHWWFVFPFFWLLWISALVTVVVLVLRRRPHRWSGGDRARAILAERFARGEISGEELRERLEQLP